MASGENHVEGVKPDSLVISASPNVFSSGQLDIPSAMEDSSLTPELRNKVFENELIRDQIFDYVFSSNRSGTILVNKDVSTCRLVDHSWLDYITSRLQKSGSPEYTLDFEYSYQSKEVQKRGPKKYQVYKFLDTWVSSPGAGSRIPLFNIEITPHRRSMEFCVQSLVKCLTLCGNGLHQLTLNLQFTFPGEDDARNGINCTKYVTSTEEINLPNLTELKVVLPKFGEKKPLVCLLLSRILSGCKRLTFLCLEGQISDPSHWSRLCLLEEEFLSGKSEQLPNTLVKLEIYLNVTTVLLEKLLLENSLPKLSCLMLGDMIGVDNDVLSRIIRRYSRQLDYFFLGRDCSRGEASSSADRVVFPVMTKLKDMCFSNMYAEPESGISHIFPILETLNLIGQTPSMLKKWIQNSRFSCVNEFTFDLFANKLNDDDIFTLELSRQLHVAFPNVQNLEINFGYMCRSEDGSIQNIFEFMPQLRNLTLRPDTTDHASGALTWDAILLGVTPEYAKTIAESPRGEWDSINLNHHSNPSRSIVNLSHLTKFHLADCPTFFNRAGMNNTLLVSDVSFLYAFLRMPNLEMLTLDGAFGATEEMVSEWEGRGRKFFGRVQREDGDVSWSEEESYDTDISD